MDEGEAGGLAKLPELPTDVSAERTARYTQAVLAGQLPLPAPIARQVQHIVRVMPQVLGA